MDAVTPDDVTAMTDAELAAKAASIEAEQARRSVVAGAEQRTDDMCLDYLRATGRTNGAGWEAPTGFLGAYPRGWRVTSDGQEWEATAPGVTSRPPGEGWQEATVDLVAFWEPRAYEPGDKVRDAGQVWTALSAVDGPRPSEYPGGWTAA